MRNSAFVRILRVYVFACPVGISTFCQPERTPSRFEGPKISSTVKGPLLHAIESRDPVKWSTPLHLIHVCVNVLVVVNSAQRAGVVAPSSGERCCFLYDLV